MIKHTEKTIEVKLFIAGDIIIAKNTLRKYCKDIGLCVTVTETDYIYSGGAEVGMIIGFINYPRFPDTLEGITEKAFKIGLLLTEALGQWSFSIVGPKDTLYHSTREEK